MGVAYKADIPVSGTTMLDRVLGALEAAGLHDITLSGYGGMETDRPVLAGGEGPADSALLACQNGPFPVLLTTCDHALLSPAMIDDFLQGARAADTDLAVGLATETVVQSAYPDTKRTYLRFADHAVSGCNLFYLADARALEALRFWRSAQALRKQPLRLARTVGFTLGLRYAAGRLSLDQAFEAVGKRLGLSAAPVLLNHPEAAIDVDCPADHALVEAILASRE